MSDFGRCPDCGAYGFMNAHRCMPTWEVAHLESVENAGDDHVWQDVRAGTPREAAEIYVENWDAEDYDVVEHQFIVVRSQAGELHYFDVQYELIPTYTGKALANRDAAIAEASTYGTYP